MSTSTKSLICAGELFNVIKGVESVTPIFWRSDMYADFQEADAAGGFNIGTEVFGWSGLCSVVENAGVAADCVYPGLGDKLRVRIVVRGVGYDLSRNSVTEEF